MYDILIIGAGVVGAMTARLLSRYTLSVCVVEKENDIAMGATKANSAIVHAGFDAKVGSVKAKLNVEGNRMMQAICEELGVPYEQNGSLVLGYNEADEKRLEVLLENGKKNGVPGLEIVRKERLRELEPGVSPEATCALYAPTGGIVCPYMLTEAAIGNAMDNGVELFRHFEVTRILRNGDGYTVIAKNGKKIKARIIINAAGLYADAIAKMVGDDSFSIHPRAGEYILLDRACGNAVRQTLFTCPTEKGKGILVTHTVDGNLLLGPTATDGEDKEDKKTTKGGLNSVWEKANKMAKGIDGRMAITSFCGLRAVGSTGDFILNVAALGFINAAGIESPGLTASPAIAAYILEMLKGSGVTLSEKETYSKTRTSLHGFRDWPLEKKKEMMKKDPSFGNIICRCEGISEGEIRHAIRTNPKPLDLDGVKRRTRAQMGRCQGGFCSPYIVQLLSEELGIPMEAVTKHGNGSYIIEKREAKGNA